MSTGRKQEIVRMGKKMGKDRLEVIMGKGVRS